MLLILIYFIAILDRNPRRLQQDLLVQTFLRAEGRRSPQKSPET